MEGVVTTDVTDESGNGRVEVLHQSWAAVSSDGKVIPAGSKVKILSVKGVKLTVTPIDAKE